MSLKNGSSKKAFEHNVSAEVHAGKPQKQALAIAYAVKRKHKMAKGGVVEPEVESEMEDESNASEPIEPLDSTVDSNEEPEKESPLSSVMRKLRMRHIGK
jgi:hypothetical protein